MTRILLDTNIILDIALKREAFFDNSAKVLKKIDNKSIFGFVSATTITDIYYISKKEVGHHKALEFISSLIQFVDVIGIDKEIIADAITSNLEDFEDSIQVIAS